MTQEAFKTWWYNEGSQAPYTHHDCEEHTMRMCEIAWNKAQLAQPEDPCKGANYSQASEQEPVAWLLTDKKINSLQVDSIHRLIDCLKHAHHTDLCVRINGQDEWFEADWLKHMVRVTPPQRKPLTDEQVERIIKANMMLTMNFAGIRNDLDEAAHGIKENT